MANSNETPVLTPSQFEEEVEKLVWQLGVCLKEFETKRLERIEGSDGIYEIDITARFEALSVNFLVLIECKHHKNPIKREVVQILHDRLRAVGAQKGMIFSTARFQKGAIKYALKNGIALVLIEDGKSSYLVKSRQQSFSLPSRLPSYVGWMISLSEEGNAAESLICDRNSHLLEEWLKSKETV